MDVLDSVIDIQSSQGYVDSVMAPTQFEVVTLIELFEEVTDFGYNEQCKKVKTLCVFLFL